MLESPESDAGPDAGEIGSSLEIRMASMIFTYRCDVHSVTVYYDALKKEEGGGGLSLLNRIANLRVQSTQPYTAGNENTKRPRFLAQSS